MKVDSKQVFKGVFTVTALAVLVACGGGGGSGSTSTAAATSTATAEGVYAGTLTGSRSTAFEMLVLENGDFWSMYGTPVSGYFLVSGFTQGSGTSTNGSYTSSDAKDFGVSPPAAGTMNAVYDTTARTISGTALSGASTTGFSGGPIVNATYNYYTTAFVPDVTGSWSTTTLTGESLALTIFSSGRVSALLGGISGCVLDGTIAPRSSGKNVFNVSLTFGASPCTTPGRVVSGISVSYPLNNGSRQLLLAVTDSARTYGLAAAGSR